jgi:uncharacterized protein (DUF736 family)
MADYQQKPNTGAIFKNKKKEKETQPEYKGTIDVDGVAKEISLWVKKSKAGESYFSVQISEVWKPTQQAQPKQEKPSTTAWQSDTGRVVDDSLPF